VSLAGSRPVPQSLSNLNFWERERLSLCRTETILRFFASLLLKSEAFGGVMKIRTLLIFLSLAGVLAGSAHVFAGGWSFGVGSGGPAQWWSESYYNLYAYGYFPNPYFPYASPYRRAFSSDYPPAYAATAHPLPKYYYQKLYRYWVPPASLFQGRVRVPVHRCIRPPHGCGPGTPYAPRRQHGRRYIFLKQNAELQLFMNLRYSGTAFGCSAYNRV
jgi:hypothetical protein